MPDVCSQYTWHRLLGLNPIKPQRHGARRETLAPKDSSRNSSNSWQASEGSESWEGIHTSTSGPLALVTGASGGIGAVFARRLSTARTNSQRSCRSQISAHYGVPQIRLAMLLHRGSLFSRSRAHDWIRVQERAAAPGIGPDLYGVHGAPPKKGWNPTSNPFNLSPVNSYS